MVIPPQLQQLAVQFLTRKLLDSKIFTSGVEKAHGSFHAFRQGLMENSIEASENDKREAELRRLKEEAEATHHARFKNSSYNPSTYQDPFHPQPASSAADAQNSNDPIAKLADFMERTKKDLEEREREREKQARGR